MGLGQRLRGSDLFALIGIVVLLAWTPAYWAQGGAEDALRGESFELPPPRDGDRLVLELIVHWQEEPPLVLGPVLEVRHEQVTDVPGATWARHETWYGADVWLGPVHWVSDPRNESWYFAADGRAVRHTANGIESEGRDPDDRVPYRVEEEDLAPRSWSPSAPWMTEPDLYAVEREHWPTLAHWFLGGGGHDPRPGREGPAMLEGRIAADHRGHRLYDADDTLDKSWPMDLFGPMLPLVDDPYRCWGNEIYLFTPLVQHPTLNVSEPLGGDSCWRDSWTWLSKEFPTPVGVHTQRKTVHDGNLLTIDLVPRILERGTGDELSRPWIATPQDDPVGRPLDTPMMPLVDLERDPRSVLWDLNLPALRTLYLSTDPVWAPGPDDRIVGFGWHPDEPGVANVSLSFHEGDGRYRAVFFAVEQTLGTYHAEPRPCPSACETVEGAPVEQDRRILDPFVLLDQTDPDRWAPHGQVLFRPLAAEDTVVPLALSNPHRETPRGGAFPISTLSLEGAPTGHDGGSLEARYDAHQNTLIYRRETRPAEASAREAEALAPAVADAVVRPYDPVTIYPAAAGLMLVATSLGVRVFGLVRTGAAAWPLALLYAKVTKDKALDQRRRAEIHGLLEAEQGLTISEVRHRIGAGWGATLHHLETLEHAGLVVSMREGPRRYFFPAGTSAADRASCVAERDQRLGPVWAVARKGPTDLESLSAATGSSRTGIQRAMRRLVRLGLVERHREGRRVRLVPCPGAAPALR